MKHAGRRCESALDAAFANPAIYRFLEDDRFLYAIRLPANDVLMREIEFHDSFAYQATSWDRPRRVVAKVEWHQGELFPRVGFIVMNLRRHARRVVRFYDGRGTAEQWIKEGKHALNWTRLSCCRFDDNQARLQLHVLAYNLVNFLRRLALPPRAAPI